MKCLYLAAVFHRITGNRVMASSLMGRPAGPAPLAVGPMRAKYAVAYRNGKYRL
jgi:hypothetical protein